MILGFVDEVEDCSPELDTRTPSILALKPR